MKRRRYIATFATAAVAGCLGNGGSTTTDPPAGGDPATTDPPVGSGSGTPESATGGGEASVDSFEFVEVESSSEDAFWAKLSVTNPGSSNGRTTVELRPYDSEGELLYSQYAVTYYLPRSTTWTYYKLYGSRARDRIDRMEASVENTDPYPSFETPAGVSVVASELTGGDTVTGEVTTGDGGRLQVVCLLWDDNGQYRGSTSEVERELPANDRWQFTARGGQIETPRENVGIDRHEVLVRDPET